MQRNNCGFLFMSSALVLTGIFVNSCYVNDAGRLKNVAEPLFSHVHISGYLDFCFSCMCA